jgi:hypothetical protein
MLAPHLPVLRVVEQQVAELNVWSKSLASRYSLAAFGVVIWTSSSPQVRAALIISTDDRLDIYNPFI